VDSVWEQKKLKARKMLENAPRTHLSTARIVGRFLLEQVEDHLQYTKISVQN